MKNIWIERIRLLLINSASLRPDGIRDTREHEHENISQWHSMIHALWTFPVKMFAFFFLSPNFGDGCFNSRQPIHPQLTIRCTQSGFQESTIVLQRVKMRMRLFAYTSLQLYTVHAVIQKVGQIFCDQHIFFTFSSSVSYWCLVMSIERIKSTVGSS